MLSVGTGGGGRWLKSDSLDEVFDGGGLGVEDVFEGLSFNNSERFGIERMVFSELCFFLILAVDKAPTGKGGLLTNEDDVEWASLCWRFLERLGDWEGFDDFIGEIMTEFVVTREDELGWVDFDIISSSE